MTNSRYNAHTEPHFRQLHMLKVKDIIDVQCIQFWYEFMNKELPSYFYDLFRYNHEVHDIGTRSHDQLHLYPTRKSGPRNVLRHHIPVLLNTFLKNLIDKIKTHSLYSISHHIKCQGSRNGNPGGGQLLVSGRWFLSLRFKKDPNGSITLCSTSTSE